MRRNLIALLFIPMMLLAGCGINDVEFIGKDKIVNDSYWANAATPLEAKQYEENTTDEYFNDRLKNVGVFKENFDNEYLYPVSQDDYKYTTETPDHNVGHIIKASKYGVVGSDKLDDTYALQLAIDQCKKFPANDIKLLVLPAGDIYISEGLNPQTYEYGLVIDGIDNLTICGTNNTNIYFNSTISNFIGIYVGNCCNFKFIDLSFDWATLPFAMGTLYSSDPTNKRVTVRVDKRNYDIDENVGIIEYLEFDKYSSLPRNKGNFAYIHNANKFISDVTYTLDPTDKNYALVSLTIGSSCWVSNPPEGTKIVLAYTMTMGNTVFMEKCTNVYYEHVNLYSSKGMAIRCHSNSNLYFNHFRAICKPGTDRLMTGTADILHLKNNAGEVYVTNSQFENSHDDAINIASHFSRIKEIKSDGSVRMISALGMTETFAPEVGDVFEVSNPETMEILTTRTIQEVKYVSEGYLVKFKEGLYYEYKGEQVQIQLDQALASVTRCPKFVFKNNVIRNKRNRGILCQTRNVLIENNVFSNIIDGPLKLMCECVYFHEAISPRDVIVRNNKFLNNAARVSGSGDIECVAYGVGYSIADAGVISNVNIDHNFFGYAQKQSISLKGVSDSTITKNYFYEVASGASTGDENCAIYLDHVDNILIKNNTLDNSRSTESFKGVFENSDVVNVFLKGNEGGFEESQTDPTPATIINGCDKTFTIDGVITPEEWTNVGTSLPIIGHTDKNLAEVKTVDPSDFSAETTVTFTKTAIVYNFKVSDDQLIFNPVNTYLGDCVEVYLTTNTTSKLNTGIICTDDTYSTLQLRGTPESEGAEFGCELIEQRTSQNVIDRKTGLDIKIKVNADRKGYTGEGIIPYSCIPGLENIVNTHGSVSFSINFFDYDDDGSSEGKMVYHSTCAHSVATKMRTPFFMSKLGF